MTNFFAIGQLRYMDWTITTPLLINMISMLKVKPHQAFWGIAALLTADIFMIVTGYFGEQQLNTTQDINAGAHYLWGTISTIGYLGVVGGLYAIWRRFKYQGTEIEQRGFKLMTGTAITFGGMYPVVYVLAALLPILNLNWIHISISITNIINKIGVGLAAYLLGKHVLEQRVDIESPEFAMNSPRA